MLLLGSANRDERAFPNADAYDLRRDTNASVSFGQGAHFCLGAALARLEGRVVLEEFWRRFPDYEVDPRGMRARALGERARLRGAAAGAARMSGRTAIVTGASSGIGADTAVELGRLGYHVALGARRAAAPAGDREEGRGSRRPRRSRTRSTCAIPPRSTRSARRPNARSARSTS